VIKRLSNLNHRGDDVVTSLAPEVAFRSGQATSLSSACAATNAKPGGTGAGRRLPRQERHASLTWMVKTDLTSSPGQNTLLVEVTKDDERLLWTL